MGDTQKSHQEVLEAKFGTCHLPQSLRDEMYQHAYDQRHSYGEDAVCGYYDLLNDIIKLAYSAGVKDCRLLFGGCV